LKGLAGSSKALLAATAMGEFPGIHLFILPGTEEAAYFYNDLINLSAPGEIYFFPSSYKRSIQYLQISSSNIVMRTAVLERIVQNPERLAIVTFPEALAEKVIQKEMLDQKSIRIRLILLMSPDNMLSGAVSSTFFPIQHDNLSGLIF